jgi:hypothetical protein
MASSAERPLGAFWQDLNHYLEDSEFRQHYALNSLRIAAIDALVNELDAQTRGPGDVKHMTIHGSRLGRDHASVRMHLAEDHGTDPGWLECASDGAVHGRHDGQHGVTWAYAKDLPHSPGPGG